MDLKEVRNQKRAYVRVVLNLRVPWLSLLLIIIINNNTGNNHGRLASDVGEAKEGLKNEL